MILSPGDPRGGPSTNRGRQSEASRDVRVRPRSWYVRRLRRSRLRADFHERIASAVASEFKGGWIVDVGCGPGLLDARLARHFPSSRLVGIDIDRRMLEFARAGHPMHVVLGTSAHLPFRDGCIDLAVSSASLKDWRGWREGLLEIVRTLRPGAGGFVYDFITTGRGSHPRGFVRRYGVVSDLLRRAMGHFAPFSLANAEGLARSLEAEAIATVRQETDLGVVGIQLRRRS